jgi:alginate O-acetyltransferase complex protein AlgI
MLFYEPLFLTAFPAVYALYLAVANNTARKWVLLVASLVFYSWGEPLFVPVLLVSALIDYALTARLHRSASARERRILLTLGVAGNLAVLVFYKYTDFLIANLDAVLQPAFGWRIQLLSIALPIGVSFVVFEKITYLVDAYRGVSPPARRFADYCLFVLYFPKLLAGPILKYHEMAAQIAAPPSPDWRDARDGLVRFCLGLAKKQLIAEPMGACADQIFGADPTTLGAPIAWLGLLAFTLQIFFDFAGYSDMAIGLSRMFGLSLRENFNAPYIARSITEFWRRWHISLTTWIRDYLYVPLGGNRDGALRTYANLWICFLLSGLWHGASWNFVLWGAYNGLFLTLDRIFLARAMQRVGAVPATVITFVIVMLGWAIFRSPSPQHLGPFVAALLGAYHQAQPIALAPDVPWAAGAGMIVSFVPALPWYRGLESAYRSLWTVRGVTQAAIIALGVIGIARAIAVPFKPFIYFRF